MDAEENQNIQMEKFKDCRGNVWKRFCDFAGKSEGFTENDVVAYFRHFPLVTFEKNVVEKFLKDFAKKYTEVTQGNFDLEFPKIRDVIRNHFILQEKATYLYWNQFKKSIGFKRDKDINEEDIKRHFEDLLKTYSDPSNVELFRKQKFFDLYSAKLNRNIEEDFPNINEWITSRCQEIKISKLISLKVSLKERSLSELSCNERVYWSQLTKMTQKETNFTDSEMTAFFKLKSETCKTNVIYSTYLIIKRILQAKFDIEFDEEFPESFKFIANNSQNIKNSNLEADKKVKQHQWQKVCQHLNKEKGFTDIEMFSYFKSKSQISTKILITLKNDIMHMYKKNLDKDFETDFPETCDFIQVTCDRTSEETRENMTRLKVWYDFCEFTKKFTDFDKKEIVEFIQNAGNQSNKMTCLLYPFAEIYSMKFKKNFWTEYPNVFETFLKLQDPPKIMKNCDK